MRVTNVRTQPTLPPPSGALQRASERVGLIGTAAWCALQLATQHPHPLTSRPLLTDQLVQALQDAGILTRCVVASNGTHRAIYEPVSWRYHDLGLPEASIQSRVEQALTVRVQQDDGAARDSLWRLLVDAESEAYLIHLLRRHRMDGGDLVALLRAVQAEWAPYCLGRRRYLAWASLRHAAASMISQDYDITVGYASLETYIRRRGRLLAVKQAAGEITEDDYCFVPDALWPRPLLLDVFLIRVAPMGRGFWSKSPPIDQTAEPDATPVEILKSWIGP